MKIAKKHTVASLKEGEKALVENINIDAVPLKILELGCLPGSQIEVLQKAPFGDPIYIRIDGVYVAVREEMAKSIEVKKIISQR